MNNRPPLTKRIRFVENVPGFADGYEAKWVDVDTVEELVDVEWVSKYRCPAGDAPFFRFSINGDGDHLMAEYDGGKWCVVGTFWTMPLVGADVSMLPVWRHPGTGIV